MRHKPQRILLAPMDICDIFQCLKSGFEELGHKAEFVNLSVSKKDGLTTSTPWPITNFHRRYHCIHTPEKSDRFNFALLHAKFSFLIARWLLFIWMIAKFDVFLFKSGESFWSSCLDQRILRIFGKLIVHAYYGSDERPNYLAPDISGFEDIQTLRDNVRKKKEKLKFIQQFARITISNPLSAQFQEGQICITQALGIPIDRKKLDARHTVTNYAESLPNHIRILHAPSAPALKGSDVFRTNIEWLKKKGYKIQYVEITGRSNAEVMKEIDLCDIVVDELYSDSFAAVFAMEAIALGKPVVVGGYGRDELTRHIPAKAAAPTLYQHPDEISDILEKLVANREFLKNAQKTVQGFSKNCLAKSVASRFIQVFDSTAPASWFMNASDIRYVKGVAAPEDKIARRIQNLIEAFGESALCLDDKPSLKKKMIAFASSAPQPHSSVNITDAA
jgi:hypothetical protein